MDSFRTEIENPVVAKDIIDLEQKIFAFKNNNIDEEKFRSLRLARGVYGQRQQGVQMVRIKIPFPMGNLKIGISTNGKSPTFAKRFRQWLENFLPEQIDDILNKLYIYRSKIKGDFEQKVEAMNRATEKLINEHD